MNCVEKHFEICCIKCSFNSQNTYICSVYRTPNSDINLFLEKISLVLDELYSSKSRFVICGDVNVNFLSAENSSCKALINVFLEYNIKPTIFRLTRITKNYESCIDNIFTDIEFLSVDVFDNEISDHTHQIIALKEAPTKENGPMDLKIQ